MTEQRRLSSPSGRTKQYPMHHSQPTRNREFCVIGIWPCSHFRHGALETTDSRMTLLQRKHSITTYDRHLDALVDSMIILLTESMPWLRLAIEDLGFEILVFVFGWCWTCMRPSTCSADGLAKSGIDTLGSYKCWRCICYRLSEAKCASPTSERSSCCDL